MKIKACARDLSLSAKYYSMVYQALENPAEPEPITRGEILDVIGKDEQVSYIRRGCRTGVFGRFHKGEKGGVLFRTNPGERWRKRVSYIETGGRIFINNPRKRDIRSYELVATAKDITEDDLLEYADKGFNCMFKTREGVVTGELSVSPDGDHVLSHAYLKKRGSPYAGENLLIPDNTVITIEDIKEGNNGKMADWGVTSFASEDSMEI